MSFMTLGKPTWYSAFSSVGFHIVFVTLAGAFLMSRVAQTPAPEKVFQLKVVHKKPPPVKKKERMPEKTVKKLAEIIPVKSHFIPQPQMKQQALPMANIQRIVPNIAPVKSPTTSVQPIVAARKFITRGSKAVSVTHVIASGPRTIGGIGGSGSLGSTVVKKTAKFNKNVVRVDTTVGAPRQVRSSAGESGGGLAKRKELVHKNVARVGTVSGTLRKARSFSGDTGGRGKFAKVAMIQKNIAKINLPIGAPRPVPNIIDKGVLRGYLDMVRRKVDAAKVYPVISRRAGHEGRVKVAFKLFKNGEVENLVLLDKTPYPKLNEEALDMVKRSAPFSTFPGEVAAQFIDVILPLSFQLN